MKLKDLNLREVMTLLPIVVLCFWIGLYPKPFLQFMDDAVMNTVMMTNPEAARAELEQMKTLAHKGMPASHAGMHAPEMPPGHPPIIMPEGHPPIMPPGHPDVSGAMMGHAPDTSAHAPGAESNPHSEAPMVAPEESGHAGHGGDE